MTNENGSSPRVAIIGAGPAGMTAGYQLAKEGLAVDLYEASPSVGGMARSFELWGQTVDLGPHRFFSQDRRVNELWLEVAGRDYAMVDRLTRILYKRKYFHYPLRAREALVRLGAVEAVRCVLSYGVEKVKSRRDDGSFEAWVCQRFGRRLFEIFFKTYSEKLWGIGCDELDADFAAQRIKQFSLAAAIKSAFSGGGGKHRTLVDQFAYPTGGTGMVYERMAERFEEKEGRLFLDTPVAGVVMAEGAVTGIELESGEVREYVQIISSMPLTALVARMAEAPKEVLACARRLKFRNTILVYLEVNATEVCRDNWMYVHSPELLTGRITNFRNWVPQLYGESKKSILALEYWCNEEDELWAEKEEALVALARRELVGTGLVRDAALVTNGKVVRVPKCYPVYGRGYRENLAPVEEYLRGVGRLQVIGRYGSFKYNNQDHSILMGMLAAENVLREEEVDLWEVNSDYEDYQEASRITETGLV